MGDEGDRPIDLEVRGDAPAGGTGRARGSSRGPWPRPLLVTVTALIAVAATLVVLRVAYPFERHAGNAAAPARRAPDTPWATLYGSALLKLRAPAGGTVVDGVNAVDSGFHHESVLEPGDYELEFACASAKTGIRLTVLLSGGTRAPVTGHADCDAGHTSTSFTVVKDTAVAIWVGSYQVASTAYAFAIGAREP